MSTMQRKIDPQPHSNIEGLQGVQLRPSNANYGEDNQHQAGLAPAVLAQLRQLRAQLRAQQSAGGLRHCAHRTQLQRQVRLYEADW